MELALPLSQEQVDCACRLHERLAQWRLSEAALEKLADKFPGFSAEACLLKTVAVNEIYGTQLFATVRMARHIEGLFASTSAGTADLGIVEQIAALPSREGEKQNPKLPGYSAYNKDLSKRGRVKTRCAQEFQDRSPTEQRERSARSCSAQYSPQYEQSASSARSGPVRI